MYQSRFPSSFPADWSRGILFFLGAVAVYLIAHFLPYLDVHTYLSDDVHNIAPVVAKLQDPTLFALDPYVTYLTRQQLVTSPLYHTVFTYPLGSFLHPIRAVRILGFLLTGLLFLAGSYPWNRTTQWIRGGLVTVVFLHLTGSVNPIMGNRRSFAPLLLMLGLQIHPKKNLPATLFVIALATGVYPPAALILCVFFALRLLVDWTQYRIGFRNLASGYFLMGATALLTLSPYLKSLFTESASRATSWVPPLSYGHTENLSFLEQLLFRSRGALFRRGSTLLISLILLSLLLFFLFLRHRKFRFRGKYILLVVSAVTLWGLAHLLHPTIYHPFKYTRVAIPLVLGSVVGENWFLVRKPLRTLRANLGSPVKISLVLGGLFSATAYVLIYRYPGAEEWVFSVLALGHDVSVTEHLLLGFLLAVPVATAMALLLPIPARTASILSLLIIGGMMFLPHRLPGSSPPDRSTVFFSELFETLRGTPKSTVVAGPPELMNMVSSYSFRNVFVRAEQRNMMQKAGKRIKKWQNAVCSSSVDQLKGFAAKNSIDYMILPPSTYLRENCRTDKTLFNREFQDVVWSKENYRMIPRNSRYNRTKE